MISGSTLQAITAGFLANAEVGTLLTVRRASLPQGTAPTTRQVRFVPQSMETSGMPLSSEGSIAVADPNKHDFGTAGGSDVQQKDVILDYDGSDWRILNIVGNPTGGVRPWLHCFAERE